MILSRVGHDGVLFLFLLDLFNVFVSEKERFVVVGRAVWKLCDLSTRPHRSL